MFNLRQMPDHKRVDCLLGRTNVKYLIARYPEPNAVKREVASIFNGSSQPSILYENHCFVPRVSVTARVFYSLSSLETLTRLSAKDYDPEKEVILATEPPAGVVATNAEVTGHVEIVTREPNAVTLRAELSRPATVVLRDRFDPNWHATVDGRETAILRADQLFRAVHVEGGRHEIRFYYRQAGLKAGLLISLASMVLLAVCYAFDPGRHSGNTPKS
jgi:hypothetical protein